MGIILLYFKNVDRVGNGLTSGYKWETGCCLLDGLGLKWCWTGWAFGPECFNKTLDQNYEIGLVMSLGLNQRDQSCKC